VSLALLVSFTNVLSSSPYTVQIVLSTAHPAKFSEAVTLALSSFASFDFDGKVLPHDFAGLLDLPRRVIDVERPDIALAKDIIDSVSRGANADQGV